MSILLVALIALMREMGEFGPDVYGPYVPIFKVGLALTLPFGLALVFAMLKVKS
ncbi:MAG: hypothetical protein R3D51_11345 [Hyphomicrobiaceae bacterium]